jgi:hypothetical protein
MAGCRINRIVVRFFDVIAFSGQNRRLITHGEHTAFNWVAEISRSVIDLEEMELGTFHS